jgi:mannose-6-phosphate isomerase-like protein (cupin superfamily)
MTTSTPVQPYVLRSGEGEALWFLGNLATIKTAGTHTRGALTVVEFLNPAGFAPPVHRHLAEDEAFYILDGHARFRCGDETFDAGPGDFVLLPVNRPHTFLVGPDQPLRALQITTPAGFEDFAAEVGRPATELRLPDPGPIDPAALGHAAGRHALELVGPPPHH